MHLLTQAVMAGGRRKVHLYQHQHQGHAIHRLCPTFTLPLPQTDALFKYENDSMGVRAVQEIHNLLCIPLSVDIEGEPPVRSDRFNEIREYGPTLATRPGRMRGARVCLFRL